MATHSSILAWRVPMDRGAWQATVCRAARSQTWPSNSVQQPATSQPLASHSLPWLSLLPFSISALTDCSPDPWKNSSRFRTVYWLPCLLASEPLVPLNPQSHESTADHSQTLIPTCKLPPNSLTCPYICAECGHHSFQTSLWEKSLKKQQQKNRSRITNIENKCMVTRGRRIN